MSEEREFEVGDHMLKEECRVCNKKLKLKEKIVLCEIQKVREGFGSVIAIPIHVDCYWVEKEWGYERKINGRMMVSHDNSNWVEKE